MRVTILATVLLSLAAGADARKNRKMRSCHSGIVTSTVAPIPTTIPGNNLLVDTKVSVECGCGYGYGCHFSDS
jgi:hypothetical protein